MSSLIYCVKCKANTDTNNPSIIDIKVSRILKKNGEESIKDRKVIKGTCIQCGSKKHGFAKKDIEPIVEES